MALHLLGITRRSGGHVAVAELGRTPAAADLMAPAGPDHHENDEEREENQKAPEETRHEMLLQRMRSASVPPAKLLAIVVVSVAIGAAVAFLPGVRSSR